MPKGNKKAKIHDVFKKRLDELVANSKTAAEDFQQSGQRTWCIPMDLEAESLFDIPNLHKPAFDRTAINVNYEQCFQNVEDLGTVGDVISLKSQVDYNAVEERAFRLRHASVCRCLTHGAGRRFGESVGPTYPYVEETLSDLIATGSAE